MTAIRHRYPVSHTLLGVGMGLVLGMLALTYQLRTKTTTELAIAAVALALVCVIVGQPRRFLFGALLLDLPLEWGKNLFYRPDAAAANATPGFELSITTFALAILYAMWALAPRRPGDRRRVRLAPALPLIVYVAINALSLLAARDKGLSLDELWVLVEALLLFIYVVNWVRSSEDVGFVVTMLLIGLVLEATYIIAVYTTHHNFHALGLANRVDPATYGGRVGGTVGSPNAAAAYLCLQLPLALALLTYPIAPRLRRLAILGLVLGVAALIITGSRGGWISFAISVALIAIWAVRRKLLAVRTLVVAAVAAVALMAPFASTLTARISGDDQGSAASRVTLTELGWKITQAHPLLGVGVNNVGLEVQNYAGPRFDGTFVSTIHNRYLLVAAESGIAALAAFVWFLASILRRGWHSIRSRPTLMSTVALGLTAGIVGQLVHMGVDIFASRPQIEGLCLAAALVVALEAMVRRSNHETAPEQAAASERATGG